MPSVAQTRIVLVTGGSRGVGADVAQQLAGPNTHVIVNYREKAKRAAAVVEAIHAAGGSASTIAADISDEAAVVAMIDHIAQRFGRLDVLVLTASGGLTPSAGIGSTRQLNRDAQRRLATLALPLMAPGSQIVFATSHQAHFFPNKAVPKGYASVAAGKRAAETALYTMRTDFSRRGINFTVTCGEMDSDDELATATADAASAPHPPGVVFVGGPHYLHPLSA